MKMTINPVIAITIGTIKYCYNNFYFASVSFNSISVNLRKKNERMIPAGANWTSVSVQLPRKRFERMKAESGAMAEFNLAFWKEASQI